MSITRSVMTTINTVDITLRVMVSPEKPMPLFHFICEKCDHDFEELVSTRDEAVVCPKCQSKKLERQTSMPGMPLVKASGCGDLSLPPCGAMGCRRTGEG